MSSTTMTSESKYITRLTSADFISEVREGRLYVRVELGLEPRGEEVEDEVFGAGGVLEDRQDGGHCAPEVVGVEGHGNVDLVALGDPTRLGVGEGRGLAEDGDLRGRLSNDADTNAGGGVDSEEEVEGQEAKEWKRGGAPKGHPCRWPFSCLRKRTVVYGPFVLYYGGLQFLFRRFLREL